MKKQRIINLTPHSINIIDDEGKILKTIRASGTVVRLPVDIVNAPSINGVPTTKSVYGKAEGLPDEKDNVYYIVSQMIKAAYPERRDLLVPTQVVRDNSGRIVGCKSLGR